MMPKAVYSATVRDSIGNLRTGLTVKLSGSFAETLGLSTTLLEDPSRPGLYYGQVVSGFYDIYMNGTRDDLLSPIWQGPSGSFSYDAQFLQGVPITTDVPAAGQYLVFNGVDLVYSNTGSADTDAEKLQGYWITSTPPQSGQFLVYNGTQYSLYDTGSMGATTLNDLTDVNVPSPSELDLLAYLGGAWVDAPYSTLGLVQSGSAETITAAWTFDDNLTISGALEVFGTGSFSDQVTIDVSTFPQLSIKDAGADEMQIGYSGDEFIFLANDNDTGKNWIFRNSDTYDIVKFNRGAPDSSLVVDLSGNTSLGGGLTVATTSYLTGEVTIDDDFMPEYSYKSNIGSLQKKFLELHAAELWVETLVAQDTIATIGGRILVGPTTTYAEDFPSGSAVMTVKHNQMTSGDIVYSEANMKVEFMQINSGPTPTGSYYNYDVIRNLEGSPSGPNDWLAGDAVFNTGQTNDGFIDLYAVQGIQGSGSGPTIVGNVRNSATFYDWTAHWALGNLEHIYGYGSSAYGVGIGPEDEEHITIDSSGNGVRFFGDDGTTVRASLTDDTWVLGSLSEENVQITPNALRLRDGTTVFTEITGSAITVGEVGASKNNIYITENELQFRNNLAVEGSLNGSIWTLGQTSNRHIIIDTSNLIVSGSATYATFGETVTVGEVGPSLSNIYITAGALQFRNNLTVHGQVNTDGSGYWGQNQSISWDNVGNADFAGTISAGNVAGAGYIKAGGWNNAAYMGGPNFNGDYRFWAGNATGSAAPFWVKQDGSARAADISIEGNIVAGFVDTDVLEANVASIFGLYHAKTGSYGDAEIERVLLQSGDLLLYGTGEETTGSAAIPSVRLGTYATVYGATPTGQSSPYTNWWDHSKGSTLTAEGDNWSDYVTHPITGSSSNDAYDDKYKVRFRHSVDTSGVAWGDYGWAESRAYLEYYNGSTWIEYGLVSSLITGNQETILKTANPFVEVTIPGAATDIRFRVRANLVVEGDISSGTVYSACTGSGYTSSNVTWKILTGGITLTRRGLSLLAKETDEAGRKEPHLYFEPHSAVPSNNEGASGEWVVTSGSAGVKAYLHNGIQWQELQAGTSYPWRMISPYDPTFATSLNSDASALSPAAAANEVRVTTSGSLRTHVIHRSRIVYDSGTMTYIKATLRAYAASDDTSSDTNHFILRLKVGGTQRAINTTTFKSGVGWSGDLGTAESTIVVGPWDASGTLTDGEGYEVIIESEIQTPGMWNGSANSLYNRREATMTWLK